MIKLIVSSLFLIGLLGISDIYGMTVNQIKLIKNSKQILLITSEGWHSSKAILQRYQRNKRTQAWKAVSPPITAVIGKKGMGWGNPTGEFINDNEPIKKEGDERTPAGLFQIGSAFGFASKSDLKLHYISLISTSVCVDDPKSLHYNQLVDSSFIGIKDWNSAETMRSYPEYEIGSVIQYNTKPVIRGKGSCIFMHSWNESVEGTSGCVALSKNELKKILNWLDSSKQPIIIIFPQKVYSRLKNQIGLL